ncbi:LTA synthase family protein [Budviciaceae bacterium CWB-B4]|uniref:LTA synthase family protein n=1 Tax=Limnobaculum xujianqingii TaxID=2738837 RepID=A0A9D7AKP9_9GAMM|nr:LTA synthase family protein [Limnobaculum xujianqingii]MBK5074366.1 LTA synthase family protein [Limnobaculum xujianqingii]MBK5177675.1 LTA synthase family protein [Limnobaculum xujianqingii]
MNLNNHLRAYLSVSNIYLSLMTIAALAICGTRFSFSYVGFISFASFVSIFGCLLLLSGRIKLSLSITSTLIVILQLLNQIKVHYYKERLFFSDVSIALDPTNFSTLFHYPLALLGIIGLIILLILNIALYIRTPKIRTSSRLLSLVVVGGLATGIIFASQNKTNIEHWQASLPKGKGTIVNLFMSAQQMYYQPPQYDGSAKYFLSASSFKYLPNAETKKPDIVVMLQESTVNPALYHLPDITLPEFKMFVADEGTRANSPLRVQTFGGGTWLSEFSLLTGLNTDDFKFRKNSVFYTVAPHIKASLFRELKNNGYYTVVLTPMYKMNYNAGPTYNHLGIDLIIQPQELGYPAELDDNLWTIPTKSMLDYVKTLLARYTDKPVFIFVLTMNEHGPYDTGHSDDFGIENSIDNRDVAGALSHYISKLKLLNEATEEFSQFIIHREKPTMFLYFGDHQPNIGWDDDYNTGWTNERRITQFFLKDNLSSKTVPNIGGLTDISFLGGMLLERAGLAVSPFYEANIRMRNLCLGLLDDCPDDQLIKSYKHYIYQDLKNAGE